MSKNVKITMIEYKALNGPPPSWRCIFARWQGFWAPVNKIQWQQMPSCW